MALGPEFAGSELISADTDLVASGLLLQLKVTVRATLAMDDPFRLIAYPLLDFPDDHQISHLGLFSARAGHLATWAREGDRRSSGPGRGRPGGPGSSTSAVSTPPTSRSRYPSRPVRFDEAVRAPMTLTA